MSRPPADAVGSYGELAIEWIERTQGIALRWWQKLAITRQLEHRADGSLCHREILESAPRRAGKSVRLRGVILWRMAWGPALFGEEQTIVHTGSDMAICRTIQKGAWRWAEEQNWKVTRANGKEAIEHPGHAEWLVRSQDAVYGYDVMLGACDEAWNVKPDTVSEGLEPATLERSSPQLHLTSTAHRRATSLMRGRLSTALATADPKVLLLLWGAPADADPGDPAVWKAASPYWSQDRRDMIASKYEKALAGEADPEFDDPDPMWGFRSQYLNIWRLKERKTQRGTALTDANTWNDLAGIFIPSVNTAPVAAAIESWFGQGYSLCLGWRDDADRAYLSVSDHDDLQSAVDELLDSHFAGRLILGSSMMDDPEVKRVRRQKGEGRTPAAVVGLARLLLEDAVRHDGGEHLTSQILAVRTVQGSDGPRMASTERADAIKAALWVASAIRSGKTSEKRKMTLPRKTIPA